MLDSKFAKLYEYDREIAIRKVELQEKEEDSNIGGGRSSFISKPVEIEVVKTMSDIYIQNRELWKKAINETLEEQNCEIKELICNKYWGPDSYMDWATFGKCHGFSRATIYRIRQKVLLNFGKKIGEW